MPLKLFTPDMATLPTRPLRVTVRPDYRLSFNAETSRALQTAGIRSVRIFGDRTTKQVVLRPAPDDAPDGHLITYVKPSSPNSSQLRSRAFPTMAWLRPSNQHTLRRLQAPQTRFHLLAPRSTNITHKGNQPPMNPKIRRPLPLLLLLLLCAPLLAQTFTARVMWVTDGDTVAVLSGATETRIRLAECDAPESAQPFGPDATHFTTSLALGHTVTVSVQDKDRYGRTIAHIITEQGLDVSTELIRAGFAWWYRQYSRNPQLGHLEAEAHSAHRGLWIDPNPTPPWDWRHTHEAVSYQKR